MWSVQQQILIHADAKQASFCLTTWVRKLGTHFQSSDYLGAGSIMELPHIGETCFVCRRNDYLPFRCNHCSRIVCVDHKADHGDDCPLNAVSFSLSDKSPTTKIANFKKTCDFCKKTTLALELSTCSHCNQDFCLYHRHQVQHNCSQLATEKILRDSEEDERNMRRQQALDEVKQLRSSHPTQVAPNYSIKTLDPKKQALARRVRVMKIKQFARGPPNIQPEDRIYFEVKFERESSAIANNVTKIFASPKHTIGRLVDWCADALKVINKNHIPGADTLVFKIKDENDVDTILSNQAPFSQYLDSGMLHDGDEITLTYKKG